MVCPRNVASLQINSYIKGYHDYQEIWKPTLNEKLSTRREPDNPVDKYAVCLLQDRETIDGHLKKGKSGRFAKTESFIFWEWITEIHALLLWQACLLILATVKGCKCHANFCLKERRNTSVFLKESSQSWKTKIGFFVNSLCTWIFITSTC